MPDTTTASATPANAASDQPFTVLLARSGQTLDVGAGESIADVLQLAGIALDTVCEQGVCGTCVTPWLAGDPEHRDSCLSIEERRTHLAVCCARSRGASLTLDL